jgi:hypothetical protein
VWGGNLVKSEDFLVNQELTRYCGLTRLN